MRRGSRKRLRAVAREHCACRLVVMDVLHERASPERPVERSDVCAWGGWCGGVDSCVVVISVEALCVMNHSWPGRSCMDSGVTYVYEEAVYDLKPEP